MIYLLRAIKLNNWYKRKHMLSTPTRKTKGNTHGIFVMPDEALVRFQSQFCFQYKFLFPVVLTLTIKWCMTKIKLITTTNQTKGKYF